jgi:hypothetical protein
MKKKKFKKLLQEKTGYLKWGANRLAEKFDVDEQVVAELLSVLKKKQYEKKEVEKSNLDPNNVLVIGDLHEPFCLAKYRSFCKEVQKSFDCGTVIFIGDVIDNHFTSYHETDTRMMGASQEFRLAKKKIGLWYKDFPEAHVMIGNHDRLVFRKAQTAGIASEWIREYHEVLNTPGWKFTEEIIIDGVLYQHGEGGTARKKMKDEHISTVGGHLHSQAYIEWSVGSVHRNFGMQVGCGIDRKSHAMAYGKNFKKPVISCGVVLNKGKFPILIPMEL